MVFLKNNPTQDTTHVNALNLLAHEYMNNANDSCLLYASQAIFISKKLNYIRGEAVGLNKKAEFFNGKGEYQKALQLGLESYKLFEKLNAHRSMSNIMNSIGNTYLGINNKAKALEAYIKSHDIAAKDSIKYMMAIASMGVGNVYMETGFPEKAYQSFLTSQTIFKQENAPYPLSLSYTLIGQALVEMERYDDAFKSFDEALMRLKQMENTYAVAGTYEIIAAAYEKQGSKKIALDFYLKAHQLFTERKAFDNIKNVSLKISNMYKNAGEFEKALQYYTAYSNFKDSVFNAESNKQLLEVEARYESDKKQQQIELQLSKLEQQQTRQKIMWIGIAIVLLLMVLLFIRYFEKQKSNKALSISNERLEVKNTIIEQKNKEITDSIEYAKRIQLTLLPSEKYIEQTLNRLNKKK
ncbi:MAG: tetratricopeptide repeat protein [Bacteroidetes bacterium]|nr:tetratricopeptide repeat protein [Bacteroidota bacterium]